MSHLIIFDFETTGLDPQTDYPTEIAMKKVNLVTGKSEEYNSMIKIPEDVVINEYIQNLTGLTTEKVNAQGKDPDEVYMELLDFIGEYGEQNSFFVAHNANFDLGFLAVHFGIFPEKYLCTRTMAILTEPDKNASLQNVYDRLFPEDKVVQEHRAQGDIAMTEKVLEELIKINGSTSFFLNKLVVMPDRDLVFVPAHAILLDFTKQYVSKRTHEKLQKAYDELAHRVEGLDK